MAWRRYFAEELAPAQRLEALIAQVAQLVHNAHCGPGREKPLKAFLEDLLEAPEPREPTSAVGRVITGAAEMEAVARALLGGARKRTEGPT